MGARLRGIIVCPLQMESQDMSTARWEPTAGVSGPTLRLFEKIWRFLYIPMHFIQTYKSAFFPIYEDLSENNLLQRFLGNHTQNANESLALCSNAPAFWAGYRWNCSLFSSEFIQQRIWLYFTQYMFSRYNYWEASENVCWQRWWAVSDSTGKAQLIIKQRSS